MQDFDFAGLLYTISVWVIPVVFAITVHEVAHGWVAKQFGDMTAHHAGRLTLNPVKHIDPIGTIIVPFAMLFMTSGQTALGWAKPVPVTVENLNSPRRDMLLVAAAGPGVNLLMALGWSLVAIVHAHVFYATGWGSEWVLANCRIGITINVLLAVFNMLPIPPLDGGRVLHSLAPPKASRFLGYVEPFGILIVLALLISGLLWPILEPPISYLTRMYHDFVDLAT